MNKMKKQLVVAVTVALLAFPISSALAQTTTPDAQVMVVTSTVTTTMVLEAAAEAAVLAYEEAPITTLDEVATAEGLKDAADTAVAAVDDVDKNAAFGVRVTDQAAVIETTKIALEALVVDEDGNEIIPATVFSDFINKLQLALTFDPARKGELTKHHALRKLAQAQKLMKDGNVDAAQICINQYTDKIAKAQAFLLEVEDTDSETAKTLEKALANVEANNIQVLGNLVDKLPPQAAQKLALNVVRTMEKAVAKIQRQEAMVALEVTPEVTAETEKKHLEKQVKVALAEFKKSVNEKRKIHIEDQDQDQDQDLEDDQDNNVVRQSIPEQEKPEMDRYSYQINQSKTTYVTVVPVKTQKAPTFHTSENNKDDRNKQGDRDKDNSKNGGDDNRRDN